jgi:hypothetical protein
MIKLEAIVVYVKDIRDLGALNKTACIKSCTPESVKYKC